MILYKLLKQFMLNRETTYSQARANLAGILDQVCDESQVVIIKRRNHKDVALIAADELSSLLESVYLLRSPENAKRLWRSLAWTESVDVVASQGEVLSQSLEELKEELGIE